MRIKLPPKKGNPNTYPEIDINQLVVIGANGSGKTRLGSWIEEKFPDKTHRITAQKSLKLPEGVGTTTKEEAEEKFYRLGNNYTIGHGGRMIEKSNRVHKNPSIAVLDDFDQLMVLLHTEEYEKSLDFKADRTKKPVTNLDTIKKIWENILPLRRLRIGAGIIEAFLPAEESKLYNASEMSDGERVIFYLIAQVVCAPKKSIVIIDEPEMHMHKSLVKKLFDLTEKERPDCTFVYLTHDIDFAFSRQNATRVWAKTYEGNNIWDYEILKDASPIPEQLYLEVLGSRKPVLFIEGDNSSIDYRLYEQVFSDQYTLKPLGSCAKVIQSVKSFNEQKGFHHIDSFGIIDRDRRREEEVTKLKDDKIWTLDVAEAENLLLLEVVVKEAARHMGKSENEVFEKVRENLIKFFKTKLHSQVLQHFKESLRKQLQRVSTFDAKNFEDALTEIKSSFDQINQQQLYDEIKKEFTDVADKADYNGIIRLFNLKNALIPNADICGLLGLRNSDAYLNLVITLLKNGGPSSITLSNAIKSKISGC
jgi:energy-coupling factor transporter ATP-binding protein EcfA2/5'-deoxynucleotidase YfbR-like HD superfamily hydrolase